MCDLPKSLIYGISFVVFRLKELQIIFMKTFITLYEDEQNKHKTLKKFSFDTGRKRVKS